MGKPTKEKSLCILQQCKEHTSGSETSQYREEKKPIGISLVAASENESSPNRRFAQTI